MKDNHAWILFRKQDDGTLLFVGFTDECRIRHDFFEYIKHDPGLVMMEITSAEKIPPIHMAFTFDKNILPQPSSIDDDDTIPDGAPIDCE